MTVKHPIGSQVDALSKKMVKNDPAGHCNVQRIHTSGPATRRTVAHVILVELAFIGVTGVFVGYARGHHGHLLDVHKGGAGALNQGP